MDIPDDLRPLAERCLRGEPGAEEALRAALETTLMPLVRCTVRRGVGVAAVVRLVDRVRATHRAQGPGPVAPARVDETAVRVARLLSVEMARRYCPASPVAAETVVA